MRASAPRSFSFGDLQNVGDKFWARYLKVEVGLRLAVRSACSEAGALAGTGGFWAHHYSIVRGQHSAGISKHTLYMCFVKVGGPSL